MTRNSVKVCIRTRPTHHFAQDNIDLQEIDNTIQITNKHEQDFGGLANNKQNSFKFKFDHIFHNAPQSAVYDLYARDTVQGVVDGINGAIMTYGQTGSGKTFTMVNVYMLTVHCCIVIHDNTLCMRVSIIDILDLLSHVMYLCCAKCTDG